MTETLHYRISGLTVASDIQLHGAIELAAVSDADVTVGLGPVPETLADSVALGPNWALAGKTFLLRVPRVGRLLIEDGRSITVMLDERATEQDASVFVLGSAFGIALHQRGAFALHASAVARNGRAIAICGHSGAGKSTLATALCQAGCEFLADDICVIGSDDEQRPTVLPDGRRIKLWRRSIDCLGLGDRQGPAVRHDFEKFFFAPDRIAATVPRLSAIYVLRETLPPLVDGIEPLGPADAMRVLDRQAYRPALRKMLGSKHAMMRQGAVILAHTSMFRFTRPLGFDHMDDIVDRLMRHWDELSA